MSRKIAIVYFSRRGENYLQGAIETLDVGNTERAAEFIQKAVGGELVRIEPVTPYPDDYYQCTEQAKKELQTGARPAIKDLPDISDCDFVFLGYPNWWGTMPMPVYTALEELGLADVTVAPFCTNEGSGLGKSERDLARVLPDCTLAPGISVLGANVANMEETVARWALSSLN